LKYFAGSANYEVGYLASNAIIVPLILGKADYIDGAHWYLIVLLEFVVVFILLNIVSKAFKKKAVLAFDIFIALLSILSFISTSLTGNHILFRLFRVVFNANFMYLCLGICLKKYAESKKIISLFSCVLIVFMIAASIIVSGKMQNLSFFAILFPIVLLCLFNRFPPFNLKVLAKAGESSLFVYLIHQRIGYLIINYFDKEYSLYFLGVVLAFFFSFSAGFLLNFSWSFMKKRLL